MIFLIQYKRSEGRIINLTRFDESERTKALDFQMETELQLMRKGMNYEVVLLEAKNEAAIRRTHQRYFDDIAKIASIN